MSEIAELAGTKNKEATTLRLVSAVGTLLAREGFSLPRCRFGIAADCTFVFGRELVAPENVLQIHKLEGALPLLVIPSLLKTRFVKMLQS